MLFLFQGAFFRFHFHEFFRCAYDFVSSDFNYCNWAWMTSDLCRWGCYPIFQSHPKNAMFLYSKFPLTCWYQDGLDRGGNGKATTGCRSIWAMKPSLAMQARVAFSSVENYSPKTKTDTWKPWNNLTMTRSMFCEGIIFLFFSFKTKQEGLQASSSTNPRQASTIGKLVGPQPRRSIVEREHVFGPPRNSVIVVNIWQLLVL